MKVQVMTYNVHGLPWSKNQSKEIVAYIASANPDIVCLQEVFTTELCLFFCSQLTLHGYTVKKPRDEGVSMLGSGLLTAFKSLRFFYVSACFYPYTIYHNVEVGANKGFFTVRVEDTEAPWRRLVIANTHTQSDTLFSIFGLFTTVSETRARQFRELVRWLERERDPVLLLGDMNCEQSPHPHIRFLKEPLLRKATMPSTGEDIDHVAWLPTQWAPDGTSWCAFDTKGVKATAYRVDHVPYSDHYPVVVDVSIPEIRNAQQGECGDL